MIWGLAIVGVVLKARYKTDHQKLFTSIYLLMGWIIVIAIHPLLALVPVAGFLWLLAGGLSYTIGVVFFTMDTRLKYGHFIWHLFVLGGTVCHYFAVFWYAG
ncbi:hemolysin III family protein [Vibrio sp. PP-XX7]